MSLLIKALKKAERRHQEVTARALEQVSTDVGLQASAQEAHDAIAAATAINAPAATAINAPAATAANFETTPAPRPALSLQLESHERAPAVAPEDKPVSPSPIEIEAMHMARALAQPAAGQPLATSNPSPGTFASMPVAFSPEARAETFPPQVREAPVMAPPVVPPASVLITPPAAAAAVPAAPVSGLASGLASTTTGSPSRPAPGSEVNKPVKKRSGWIRVTAFTMAGTLAAGGFLAWQAMRIPGITSPDHQSSLPALAPPAPQPTAEQLKEAYGNREGKMIARPGDSPRDSTTRSTDAAARAGTRNGKLAGELQTPGGRLESQVGPQIALNKPSSATPAGPAGPVTATESSAKGGSTSSAASSSGNAPSGSAADARPDQAPAARSGSGAGPRLIRQDNNDRVAKLLEQAFAASGKQDRRNARQLYDQVLDLDRNNVDAMLGIASLTARDGDSVGAERIYQRVLDLDPQDAAARAGLASLRVSADPAGQESQLRHLLASDPAQPSLQFALGNSLAAQGRWNDAQQAYFQAFSGDNRQPDYAFNLAISLERMHQGSLALMYYKNALDLARTRPARFRPEQVRSRIEALERSSIAKSGGSTEATSTVAEAGKD